MAFERERGAASAQVEQAYDTVRAAGGQRRGVGSEGDREVSAFEDDVGPRGVSGVVFVIDAEGIIRYWGAIDNDKNFRTVGDRNFVEDAIKSVMAGETVTVQKTRAYGCSVKYKG